MSSRVVLNPAPAGAESLVRGSVAPSESTALAFHRLLPDYNETRMHSLPNLAQELGLSHVLVKDESDRFGLPAYKILGASWAVYRAVGERLGLDVSDAKMSLQDLGKQAQAEGIKLVTSTAGNWGRAVARMAKYLGIPARIYVPSVLIESSRAKIRDEGAEVIVIEGYYDQTVPFVLEDGKVEGMLMVMDFGLEGYEQIPRYVIDGYSTMLLEAERQAAEATGGKPVTHAIIPVGAGSVAQAVVEHYKGSKREPPTQVLTVEPTAAPCFATALEAGKPVNVETRRTIMDGMNCSLVSDSAWPVLNAGVAAAVQVDDQEDHAAVGEFHREHVPAGPCGAATLAALRRVVKDKKEELGLGGDSVVVLYSTEGSREYPIPS